MHSIQIVWLDFDYMNKHYKGETIPSLTAQNNSLLPSFDIYFDNEYSGTILKDNNLRILDLYIDNGLVKIIQNKPRAFFND